MDSSVIDMTEMTPLMTRRLNEVARFYRQKYTVFIDDLSIQYGGEEFWWDTNLASRHIACSCFEKVVKLELIRGLLEHQRVSGVIVEDKALAQVIEKNFSIPVTVKKRHLNIKNRIFGLDAVQRVYNYRRFARRVRKFRKKPELRKCVPRDSEIILISECAIPSELKNGVFRDRYFPDMLEKSSRKLLFIANLVYAQGEDVDALIEYLTSHSSYAICDCFNTEQDLAEIRRYIRWCRRFRVSECKFDGLDVTDLILDEIRRGAYNSVSIVGILKGNAILRLIEEQNLHVTKLIDWFEGQASSSAVIRRFRKKYPQVKTMSYVNSPSGENNLGLYPTPVQYEKRVVSECFGVQGVFWEEMERQFCEEVKCVRVPSFRQLAVFNEGTETEKRRGILITVPYFLDVAKQLLHDFFVAVSDADAVDVIIKNHPARESMRLEDYGIEKEEYEQHNVSYVTGELSEALKGKRAVIMSKTTMALEVMLTGTYTILYLYRGELSNFCMPDGTEQYQNIACDETELRKLLQGEMNGLGEKEIKILRDKVFARVESETMEGLLT